MPQTGARARMLQKSETARPLGLIGVVVFGGKVVCACTFVVRSPFCVIVVVVVARPFVAISACFNC